MADEAGPIGRDQAEDLTPTERGAEGLVSGSV